MKFKVVETRSGARYRVFPDGRLERGGTARAIYGVAIQYHEGTLMAPYGYDDLAIGGHLNWFGREVGHPGEWIVSSVIESVEEFEVEG